MPKNRKYLQNQEVDEVNEIYRRVGLAHARVGDVEKDLFSRNATGGFIEPDLLNGCAQPSPPLEPFAYRIWTDGRPQFTGHIDVGGATSPVVAFNIPDDELVLGYDRFYHTIITDGSTFQTAMFVIDSVTGDVTFTWPAS